MAHVELVAHFQEIKYNDIEFLNVVNSGTFGVVKEANWNGQRVAVKTMESEEEKKAFRNELKQLSRIRHANIVKLFGAVNDGNKTCLVMEFADGGSLYEVLHSEKYEIQYSTAHGLSWMLQCARGVEYLHGIKLVHRDLKSPNLLLVHPGTVLKICDFGTACEARTHMTNCTGSAAWMAPEVFEDTKYSEKCDVYSFGVILWEVLSGSKPFSGMDQAFKIMWAVHQGTRPNLIYGVPDILQNMITTCWDPDPSIRPSFATLCKQLTYLVEFFKGAEQQPLEEKPSQLSAGPLEMEGATTQIRASSSASSAQTSAQSSVQSSTQSSASSTKQLDSLTSAMSNAELADPAEGEQEGLSSPDHLGVSEAQTSGPCDGIPRRLGDSIFSSLRRPSASPFGSTDPSAQSIKHPTLDNQLQPLPPYSDSAQSVQLFEEHSRLADEFMELKRRYVTAQEESLRLDDLLLQDKRALEMGQLRLRRFDELLQEKERLSVEQASLHGQLQHLMSSS